MYIPPIKFIERLKSKVLTYLFTEWVKREWDLELLGMTKGMIASQELIIKQTIDISNRITIKGYRK